MNYTIDSKNRLIGTPIVPLFNKGTKVRDNYTVHSKHYHQMTSSGIRTYGGGTSPYAEHNGDDFVALSSETEKYANGTYKWVMPFTSMMYIKQNDTITNTMILEGYDKDGNLHQIRACHCSKILITPGQKIVQGTECGVVSDVGAVQDYDNSHLHITYKVNGSVKSIAAVLFGVEAFPDVRASLSEFEETDNGGNESGEDNEETSVSITGYGLYTSKAGVNIRSEPNITSSVKILVPKGNELKIKRFIDGFQPDGWQWAETYFDGEEGFSRVETLNSYTVVKTDTSVQVPGKSVCVVPKTLYLVMSASGGYIRTSIPSGSRRFIPAGTLVQVTELINEVKSDGYQWVKAIYDGEEGYIQADTCNWHYFKIL